MNKLRIFAKKMKVELGTLFFASQRSDIGIIPKAVVILVVAYALSPIDLIPDFIPVLGYVDDLILLPIGIALAVKLIPTDVLNECRKEAIDVSLKEKPKNWIVGAIIVFIWLIVLLGIVSMF